MVSLNCSVFGSKKLRFIKKQDSGGLLSNNGLKTPLRKVPLLGSVLLEKYKLNEIINKFY